MQESHNVNEYRVKVHVFPAAKCYHKGNFNITNKPIAKEKVLVNRQYAWEWEKGIYVEQ